MDLRAVRSNCRTQKLEYTVREGLLWAFLSETVPRASCPTHGIFQVHGRCWKASRDRRPAVFERFQGSKGCYVSWVSSLLYTRTANLFADTVPFDPKDKTNTALLSAWCSFRSAGEAAEAQRVR